VITVWHTFCEGNEECAVKLERLMGDELDYYVIEEMNVTRELEKSTIEWATLYLFQTRSLYPNPETRAVALTNMFRERTATTERTWRKQGLTEVSEAVRANPDHPATSRSQPRTHPARSTYSTAGSQRGANTPGLGATGQATPNTQLNEHLHVLRAQLAIAIFTEQTLEAAAVAAAIPVHEGEGPPPQVLPMDALAATSARVAADLAVASVVRIQSEITNLTTARVARSTLSYQRSEQQESRLQMEHRAMKKVLKDLLKDSPAKINPATILLLGKPASPHKPQRPSPLILSQFCAAKKLVEPQDVDSASKMASLGNYSYLVMNN
jgi:hypothetical protein